MGRQQIHVHADSTASPQEVWPLLADATTWSDWAGFDETGYQTEGSPDRDGLGAVRRMRFGRLRSLERVLAFEPDRHFAYDYDGTLPLKDYRADVRLTPHEGGTRITWDSEFAGKWPMSGPLLRRQLTKVLQDIANRLARTAEQRRA